MRRNRAKRIILRPDMKKFLDDREGQDLIRSVHDFRETFNVDDHTASDLVEQWQDTVPEKPSLLDSPWLRQRLGLDASRKPNRNRKGDNMRNRKYSSKRYRAESNSIMYYYEEFLKGMNPENYSISEEDGEEKVGFILNEKDKQRFPDLADYYGIVLFIDSESNMLASYQGYTSHKHYIDEFLG